MSSRSSSSSTSTNSSGRACIAQWTSCLRQLEGLARASADSAYDAHRLEAAAVEVLRSPHTPMPVSPLTWAQLVLQLKMPLRLGSICSKVAQHQPRSVAMQAVIWRLHEFLKDMHDAGISSSSSSSRCGSLSAPLQVLVAEQLEQSGLLEHLPGLLTAVAEGLTQQTARHQQPAQHSSCRTALSAAVSDSNDGRNMAASQRLHSVYEANLLQFTVALHLVAFQAWHGIEDCHAASEGPSSSRARCVAAFAPALMHLMTAVMQYASAHVQDLEAATWAKMPSREFSIAVAVRAVVQGAFTSTITVLGGFSDLGGDFSPDGLISLAEKVPAFDTMLQSPHMLPWCALMCTVMGTWWLTTSQPETPQDVQQAGHVGTGSTISRQSVSEPQQQHEVPANTSDLPSLLHRNADARLVYDSWQRARHLLPHAVPPSCAELFQLLGVDSRVVAWAATITQSMILHHVSLVNFIILYASLKRVRSLAGRATSGEHQPGEQAAADVEEQQPHQRKVHALLCILLLHVAASMAPTDQHCNSLCRAATHYTHSAIDGHSYGYDDAFQQLGNPSQEAAVRAWVQQQGSPAFWLDVLPLMVKVCGKVAAQLQQASFSLGDQLGRASLGAVPVGGTVTAADPGCPSAQCSTVSSSSNSSQALGILQPLKDGLCTLSGLFTLFACVDSTSRLQTSSTTSRQAAHSAKHRAPAATDFEHTLWFITAARSHASEIFTLLDGVVRTVAAQQTLPVLLTGSPASGMVQLDVAGMMMRTLVNVALLTAGPIAYSALCFAPSSKERQQFHSLLFSLTKLSNTAAGDIAVFGSMHATRAAAAVLSGSWQVEASLLTGSSSAGSSSGGTRQLDWFHQSVVQGVGLTEVASVPDQSLCRLQSTASVLSAVPSLALLGCCCLQCARRLRKEMPDILQQPADFLNSSRNDDISLFPFAVSYFCLAVPHTTAADFHIVVGVFKRWLQHPSVSAQLAAAGYKPDDLLQQLEDLLTARQAAEDSMTADTLAALVEKLQATGMVFASLAHPVACNNAKCSNVSGPTELQLVSGRSCICGGCRTARYCSRACQKTAWKQHKPVCAALSAAAAAAAGGGSGGGGGGGGAAAAAAPATAYDG